MPLKLLLLACSLIVSMTSFAQSEQAANPFASTNTVSFGQTQTFLKVDEAYQLKPIVAEKQLELLWEIAPAYYLYKDRFAFSVVGDGETLTLEGQYEKGIVKYDEAFQKDLEVFYNSTEVLVNTEGLARQFTLKVSSQGCADAGLCYPPQHQYFSVNLDQGSFVATTKPAKQAAKPLAASTTEDENTPWLPYILLIAILGGAILNLMPCVFPVLSIKALSIANADNDHRSHGWAYTLGVVTAFLVVAGLMLAARASGEAVGWGFQLQSPILVSLLAYLFFVMGLSLSGLADFGSSFMGVGQNLTDKEGLRGSFFTGVLAAVVASPCTAPFMGTALGYALTQPTLISLSVFGALGFGMAIPFLLICYIPALSKYLPQPGPWMETLKQCLAFPLYLAAIWLIWVLGRQAGSDAIAAICTGATLIAFGLWLSSKQGGILSKGLMAAALAAAIAIPFNLPQAQARAAQAEGIWAPYKQSEFASHQASGRPIFINLTADWCITCLANERVTLGTDTIKDAFKANNVITLKGDWTNYNAEITELLTQYGRSGVPLYLYFSGGPGETGQILPQILSTNMVLDALNQGKGSKS